MENYPGKRVCPRIADHSMNVALPTGRAIL